MKSRELYICIRFSKGFSEKLDDYEMRKLKKRVDKETVPNIKKAFKNVDKKVTVWSETG